MDLNQKGSEDREGKWEPQMEQIAPKMRQEMSNLETHSMQGAVCLSSEKQSPPQIFCEVPTIRQDLQFWLNL